MNWFVSALAKFISGRRSWSRPGVVEGGLR